MAKPLEALDPQVLKLAAVLVVGVLAVVFDTTIVNVALDRLAEEMAVPVSVIQWVTTGYLLALAMAVPVTGWLLDRFGGKPVWMAALALFLVGSIAASCAWDAPSLIAFRVVQGIGGGLMLPVMQTLLVQAAGPRSLGRITAIVALPALLGPILGPVLGGFIIEAVSWRWIFWINIPVGLAGLALAARVMPAGVPERRLGFDGIGFILVSPGIAAILYGLSRVALDGVASPGVLLPLLAGLLLVGAFTARTLTMTAPPLVDIGLLRVPSLAAATVQLFLSGFVLYGTMLLIPLYAQQVLGYGTFAAGLLLAPQGVGALLSRPIAGRLSDSIGARWIVVAGFGLVVAGTLPFTAPSFDMAGDPWLLSAALVVRGLGLGAVTIPVMAAAYIDLDRPQVPHASIITRTAQQIGGSFGTAVLAILLESATVAQPGAIATAFAQSFEWAIGFTLLALVAALWLPARTALVAARRA